MSKQFVLLRNCLHGSEIGLYKVIDNGDVFYRKVSYLADGRQNLKNEADGYEWYLSRFQSGPSNVKFCEWSSFAQLDIPNFFGVKGVYSLGLTPFNIMVILKTVSHYVSYWEYDKDQAPFHGDLSIDNILYDQKSDSLIIIDWEHFNKKGLPWGFDIFHLLFETIWFNMNKYGHRLLIDVEKDLIHSVVSELMKDQLLPDVFRNNPLSHCIQFFEQNPFLWGDQLLSFQSKFPVLSFSSDTILNIDAYINSVVKNLLP